MVQFDRKAATRVAGSIRICYFVQCKAETAVDMGFSPLSARQLQEAIVGSTFCSMAPNREAVEGMAEATLGAGPPAQTLPDGRQEQ